MKKVSCNIIRDMLPLYVDDLISDETRAMVEEHIGGCEACCREAFALKQEIILPSNPDLLFEETKMLLSLKRQMWLKKLLAVVISVLLVVGVLTGIYYWASTKKICVSYEEKPFVLVNHNGYLWVRYKGGYEEIVSTEIFERQVEKGGKTYTYNTMILCVYDTLWSRYIEPLFWWNQEEEEGFLFLGATRDLDHLYYGDFGAEIFYRGETGSFDDLMWIWAAPNYTLQ